VDEWVAMGEVEAGRKARAMTNLHALPSNARQARYQSTHALLQDMLAIYPQVHSLPLAI
jgi:hypothetical protein